jgi:two-component system, OmpR family, phosphate regulon response regulator PhoB
VEERGGRVLLVEDDAQVRALVVRVLEEAGIEVDEAEDALTAMAAIGARVPDLVILDIGLPDVPGLDVLERIRRVHDVPVVVLTGAGSEGERVAGLKGGADDYVVKPFYPAELAARIERLLHPRNGRRALDGDPVLRFDGLEIDPRSRECRVRGETVALTAKEFDLLAFLAGSARQVFSREQLLRNVWASSGEWQDDATVTEHVRRIRRKVEADPDQPRWLRTVRGVGYRFEP